MTPRMHTTLNTSCYIQFIFNCNNGVHNSPEWYKLFTALKRLSELSLSLPPQLYMHGVECSDKERMSRRRQGGFADIYLGTYQHAEVAMKVLRTLGQRDGPGFMRERERFHKVYLQDRSVRAAS